MRPDFVAGRWGETPVRPDPRRMAAIWRLGRRPSSINVAEQRNNHAPPWLAGLVGRFVVSRAAMEETSFRDRVRHAVFWRAGTQIAQQAVQWALTLLVIRLLHPADYGLLAMAEVVTSFLTILAFQGISSAIVQAPQITDRQIRQFFGLLIVVNTALALIQIGLAPVAAAFYRQPIIADILRVQAVLYLLLPFISLPVALASRRLDFKKPALVHFVAMISAGVLVLGLAFQGYGVWALIGGTIMLHIVRAVGMAFADRWLIWPEFRFDGLGELIRYGATVMMNSVLWLVYAQADVFIGGRYLRPTDIGLYTEALFLSALPVTKFIPALNEVGASAYARIQDDAAAVRWNLTRAAGLVATLTFPIFFGLAAVADVFVPVVMGPQWTPSVPYIETIAYAMPLYALSSLLPAAVNALGRPDVQTGNSIIGLIIMPLAFLIGVQFGGIGLARAWLIGYPVLYAIIATRSLRVIGASHGDFLRPALPALVCSGVMAALLLATRQLISDESAILRMTIYLVVGAASYSAALWVLFPGTRRGLITLVRR